ncbi:MAG TPA: MarP family serine protease [Candidatus Saccharimonadales bacterium]|nr:MarP family serine protease [Candidatus Saccharimonadales bacterium]
MIIDIAIVIFAVSALYRGREIGFVRQLFSTGGFFGGLFLGAWLEHYTVHWAHSQTGRSLITLATTLGCALILLAVGEYAGIKLKHRVVLKKINILDNGFGGLLSVVSLLLTIWLLAAVVGSLPVPAFQSQLRDSKIVSALNRALPGAPGVISNLGRLVDPNGFPQVFIGGEPAPNSQVNVPSLGDLQAAVDQDRDSVVKIEGQGCGGVVEGSGFVAGSNLVATNAHVVAGIRHPYVEDGNGTHSSTVIWFDPDLDFAVLRVSNLEGHSLVVADHRVGVGTPAAVLGYPGGGGFKAGPAAVSNQFTASGRDIYGQGDTLRQVYELQADIIPGNSGGPLVAKDGTVIGVIFAESTDYPHTGYALTSDQVKGEINQAAAQDQPVGTGRCAE